MNTLTKKPRQHPASPKQHAPSLFIVNRAPQRVIEQHEKEMERAVSIRIAQAERPVYPQIIMPEQPVGYLKAKRYDPL
jgi:hypothetical protein